MTTLDRPPAVTRSGRPLGTTIAIIFLTALALRWAYASLLYELLGAPALMSGDSYGYLPGAQQLVAKFTAGELHGWDWLGPDLSWMPLFPWLTALNVLLFGSRATFATVLCQGCIDACTCVLIYAMARSISPRYAAASGFFAAINPTQIVLSGLLLTDTLFLFFCALALLGALLWMRQPTWRSAAIIAAGLGGGTLTRVFMLLWCPILLVFLLAAALLSRRLTGRSVAQYVIISVVTVLSIAPILARNVTVYGAWALTSQGGTHLLYWVVPLVNEAKTGTPWAVGSRQMADEFHQRFPQPDPNPFVEVRRHSEFGREKLMELGVPAIAKAWLTGAAINLFSPAIIASPPVADLPRTGFYDTRGANAFEKIGNFLFRSDNALFAWIAIVGIVGVALIGLLQIAGALALLWEGSLAVPLLFILWTGFILFINGPVASPKYRLPVEPVLVLLTGLGFCAMKDRVMRRSNHSAAPPFNRL